MPGVSGHNVLKFCFLPEKWKQWLNTKGHLLCVCVCVIWFETVLFQIKWIISKFRSQPLIRTACSESWLTFSSSQMGIMARNLLTWCRAILERWAWNYLFLLKNKPWRVCVRQNNARLSSYCTKIKSAPRAHGAVALRWEDVPEGMPVSLPQNTHVEALSPSVVVFGEPVRGEAITWGHEGGAFMMGLLPL